MIDRMGQLTSNTPGFCVCGASYPTAAVRCSFCRGPLGTAEPVSGAVLARRDEPADDAPTRAELARAVVDLQDRIEQLESHQRHAAAKVQR